MKPVTIAPANQKGGVAKTTTSESLAAAFTERGLKTLLIDMDPQTNASQHCGFDLTLAEEPFLTMYDVLSPLVKKPVSLSACIQHCKKFDLAPASGEMASLELEFAATPTLAASAANRLSRAIRKDATVMSTYDVIVVDGGPTQGLLNMNILCAADYCLIPTECTTDSANAIATMIKTIQEIQNNELNTRLDLLGIAIVKYQSVTKDGQKTLQEIREAGQQLGIRVFNTLVRYRAAVERAKRAGMSIFDYAPRCDTAADYMSLADEIISVLNLKGE